MKRTVKFLVFALAVVLLGLIPATMFRSRDAVMLNKCQLRLHVIQAALVTFKSQKGSYPETLQELVPQFCSEDELYCPESATNGVQEKFVYHHATNSSARQIVICRTPSFILVGRTNAFVAVTLAGEIVFLSKPD